MVSGEFQDGELWFELDGDGARLTIGTTDLGLEKIGAVQQIGFPGEGEEYGKDESLFMIEGTNGSLEVISPAAGVVSQINTGISEEPEIVNDDPLGEGWLIKLEIEDETDLKEYLV